MHPWKTAFAAGLFAALTAASPAANAPASGGPLAEQARQVLRRIATEDTGFVGVHAAEVLAAYGEAGTARRIFAPRAAAADSSPTRIGIWRVLAIAAPTPAERAVWIGKIERIAVIPGDPDRLRSLETLGKLRVPIAGRTLEATLHLAATAPDSDASLPLWVLALSGEPGAVRRLAGLLSSGDVVARQRAAYALRWLGSRDPAVLTRLAQAAEAEPPRSAAYPFLLSAAFTLHADPARMPVWQSKLEHLAIGISADARFEASQALMPTCTAATLPLIAGLLRDPDANTRVGAAWTILYADAHGITAAP